MFQSDLIRSPTIDYFMQVDTRVPIDYKQINRLKEKRLRGLNNVIDQYICVTLSQYYIYADYFRRKYRLRYEGFETLSLIFMSQQKGASVFYLASKQLGSYQAVRARMNKLIRDGLIEVIGKGAHGCNTYRVTQKFINELIALT